MNKQCKKSILSLLSALVLSCSGVALGTMNVSKAESVTKNAADVITMNGLTATYNVSGGEMNSKFVKDKTGIHFSATANGNAAEGASVSFNNTLSGLFEMDFRVYTENVANIKYGGGNWWNGNDAEEVREVAITLTDTDANQSFTLYIKGGTPYMESVPNARVAYGDVGANYGTGIRYGYSGDGKDYDDTKTPYDGGKLSNTEYNTQLKGTSFSNWYLHSTVVGFDPLTKEVYSYNFKSSSDAGQYTSLLNRRVILDLDNTDHLSYIGTGASELLSCDFNNYTVKFTVTDVTGASDEGSQGKDEPVNFLIYTLNGQSLAGENGVLTSSVAPGLAAEFTEDALQYQDYVIPTPTLQGVLGEKATFDGNVKVLDPNGNVVVAQQAFTAGMSFTPEMNGEYIVVYSGVKDSNGNVRKAFTASGAFTGDEIIYSYPLQVEKSYIVTANASDLITANGLDVTYNVSGSQQHADLIRDTNKGILFTSQGVGAEANGASVAFNNTLVGEMELNFRVFTETTDSASDWWDSGEWHTRNTAEELREIAITVTDEVTHESFTIYIKGGTMYNAITPNARVAYGDVGANHGTGRWYKTAGTLEYYREPSKGLTNTDYNTALYGTTFTNRARNSAWIGSGYSTNIGFDPVTKMVYGYTYCTGEWECTKLPILDLDDPEDMQYLTMNKAGGNVNAGLPEAFLASTFQTYSVKVTVTDVTEDTTAKFIIYHLNGQGLNGQNGKLMSTSGYGMYAPEGEARFVGLADSFPMPYASSVLTGEKAFEGTIEIVDENGNVVLPKQTYSDKVTFTPAVAGNYVAYYGGMADENGCVRLGYHLGTYSGEEERFAYAFEVKDCAIELNTYDYAMAKMGVEIGAKTFASNVTTLLTIRKDGAVYNGHENVTIGANYTYAFQDSGTYELIYTVTNAAGGQVSYSSSINVIAMTGFIKTAESVVMLGEDAIWDQDDFTIYYCDEGEISDFLLTAKVYDGSEWIAINTVPAASVNLNEALLALGEGEWLVAFEISKGGESIVLEKTFISKDGSAPVVRVESFGEGFISVPEQNSETVHYFVVLEGTESAIPAATAMDEVDGAVAITILLKTPTDTSAQEISADTIIRFTAGEYVIVYKAVDAAGNEASFFYFVTVKTLWLTITAEVDTLELGAAANIPTPNVINGFTGQEVTDFTWTAKVTLGGDELKQIGGKYVPVYTGEYAIVYTVTYGDLSQEWTLALFVEDTTAPSITVDGEYAAEASIGDTITVLEAEVDDQDTTSLTVTVLYNGTTKIQLTEDNEFAIDKAGKYVIRYTATDMSGNNVSVEYTITVAAPAAAQPSTGGCAGSVGSLAAVGVLMAVAGVLSLRKKENE